MIKDHTYRFKFILVCVLQVCSLSLHAGYFWYQPAPVVVYQQPSAAESIVTGVAALGVGIGCGVAAIVKHTAKKQKFKEYVETFRDMGYSKQQAKIYAQMALDNPEGLQAVLRSIDQKNLVQAQIVAQQEMMKSSHDQDLKVKKEAHDQKMIEFSHEYKLKMLMFLVVFLSLIIFLGGLFLFYNKRSRDSIKR
ncbi:hypothetical protein KBD08_02760 [Candidatus Babeliales bacterium]|nr:hypothetical protein [Candidatus Babeliales bacterium]